MRVQYSYRIEVRGDIINSMNVLPEQRFINNNWLCVSKLVLSVTTCPVHLRYYINFSQCPLLPCISVIYKF